MSQADHNTTTGSYQALSQTVHFLQTWHNTGVAEIRSPYSF